jgi:hypothetical protein
MPSRLVDFASALVADIGGVWEEIADIDSVLSVLIPVHVRSPRRVKVLINRFALTYTIASKRVAAGSLGDDLALRASELAKLVCLRTEFPLFAAELEQDTRVVDAITAYLDAEDLEESSDPTDALADFDEILQQRALKIIGWELLVDELLVQERCDDPDSETSSQKNVGASARTSETVQRAHAAQLLDYLRQTRAITGPRQDLVNLESIGAAFGADPAFAQDLADAALGNHSRRVLDLLSRATSSERTNGLLVLGAIVRRSRGNDAKNAMRSLLRACANAGDSLIDVAPRLVGLIDDSNHIIDADELSGAVILAVRGKSQKMLGEIMNRGEMAASSATRAEALKLSPLIFGFRERLGKLVALELETDRAGLSSILVSLPDDDATALMQDAVPHLAQALNNANQPKDDDDDDVKSSRVADLADGLAQVARELNKGGRHLAAEQALLPLVEAPEYPQIMNCFTSVLSDLAPIVSPTVVKGILNDIPYWTLAHWTSLFAALDLSVAKAVTTKSLVELFAERWWQGWFNDDNDMPSTAQEAINVLASLRAFVPDESLDRIEAAVRKSYQIEPSPTSISHLRQVTDGAQALTRAGVLSAVFVSEHTLNCVAAMLSANNSSETADPETATSMITDLIVAAIPHATTDPLQRVADAARDSAWLPSPARELVSVLLDNALPETHRNGIIDADRLSRLYDEYGQASYSVIAAWLSTPAIRSANEFLTVTAPWVSVPPPPEVRRAIRSSPTIANMTVRNDLALRLASSALRRHPSQEFLADIGFREADEDRVSKVIVKLVAESSNEDDRIIIFDLWNALTPIDATIRRRLIMEVMVPIAGRGKGAYELVRMRLKLAADPPYGTKSMLVQSLLFAAPDTKLKKRMESRMEEVELKRKPKRFGLR